MTRHAPCCLTLSGRVAEAVAGLTYNESRANKYSHALDAAHKGHSAPTVAQPAPAPSALRPDSEVRRKYPNPGSWVPPERFPTDSSQLELFYGLVKLEDSTVEFAKVPCACPAHPFR